MNPRFSEGWTPIMELRQSGQRASATPTPPDAVLDAQAINSRAGMSSPARSAPVYGTASVRPQSPSGLRLGQLVEDTFDRIQQERDDRRKRRNPLERLRDWFLAPLSVLMVWFQSQFAPMLSDVNRLNELVFRDANGLKTLAHRLGSDGLTDAERQQLHRALVTQGFHQHSMPVLQEILSTSRNPWVQEAAIHALSQHRWNSLPALLAAYDSDAVQLGASPKAKILIEMQVRSMAKAYPEAALEHLATASEGDGPAAELAERESVRILLHLSANYDYDTLNLDMLRDLAQNSQNGNVRGKAAYVLEGAAYEKKYQLIALGQSHPVEGSLSALAQKVAAYHWVADADVKAGASQALAVFLQRRAAAKQRNELPADSAEETQLNLFQALTQDVYTLPKLNTPAEQAQEARRRKWNA
ncbi:MAG: hypothetical protein SFZ03_03345 [Candidatus Melainabacteria bacterium]|nr:hypothetical protein [Candidatus Melainabacteria bacterium]